MVITMFQLEGAIKKVWGFESSLFVDRELSQCTAGHKDWIFVRRFFFTHQFICQGRFSNEKVGN